MIGAETRPAWLDGQVDVLEGGGAPPVHSTWLWVVFFLDGLGLLVLFQAVKSFRLAFWSALAAIPALAVFTSLGFTGTLFGLWPHTIPLFIAVLIQQLYAHGIRYRNEQVRKLTKAWSLAPDEGIELD